MLGSSRSQPFSRKGHTQHLSGTLVSRCTVFRVGESLREEGKKEGKKECLCVPCTAVTQCVSVCGHTLFFAQGEHCAPRHGCSVAAPPFPKAVTHSDSLRRPPPGHYHQGFPSAALTLGMVLDRTAECCVRHSRADCVRAQNAVLPHSHGEGPPLLPGLGSARRRYAVLPLFTNAKDPALRGTTASLKVHHGASAPLSLFEKPVPPDLNTSQFS